MNGILLTKFTNWQFEHERRVLIRLKDEQKDGQFYFAEFDDKIRPCTVFLGVRCAVALKTIQKAVACYEQTIEVKRGALSPNTFGMIENDDSEKRL